MEVNCLPSSQYSVKKNGGFKTLMLRSDFCDFSDIYSCKKAISVAGDNDDKTSNKQLIFKHNAPFRSCMSKINNTFTDNAEDLDIFLSIHNLLQYNDNYFMTSGSF